ncbi:MAG: alpha/beta hydrolase [Methylococcales bacterium]|nr:alpha/beta hydrolase [Methylococcaceae bacterium]
MSHSGWWRLLIVLAVMSNLTACTLPAVKLQNQAREFGFIHQGLSANGLVLSAFYKDLKTKTLHVYLEGDGHPWEQGVLPASDPTTRSSLMLPLMALDNSSSLYLGRPCYNGHAEDSGCDSSLWTNARYGEQVISSMAIAVTDFCRRNGFDQWVLIGHSGGGSLAILLAERLPQTTALVTLAANYDIDVWADHHHYTRLTASKNPAAASNMGIPEWHFLAEKDATIPPHLFFQALKNRKNSQVEIIPDIDHNSGWDKVWPKILAKLSTNQ